jgi:serine/threonine-protein kinase
VIAFECLTGERPFTGDGLRALFGAICLAPAPVPSTLCPVPRGFDAWFEKAVNKDPAQRFRSAAELASTLRQVCEQELALTPTVDEADGVARPSVIVSAASSVAPAVVKAAPDAPRKRNLGLRWALLSALIMVLAGWLSARWLGGSRPAAALPAWTAERAAAADPQATEAATPAAEALPIKTEPAGAAAPVAPTPPITPVVPPPPAAVHATHAAAETADPAATRSQRAASARSARSRARPQPRAKTPEEPAAQPSPHTREPEPALPAGPAATRRENASGSAASWDVDRMLRDRK